MAILAITLALLAPHTPVAHTNHHHQTPEGCNHGSAVWEPRETRCAIIRAFHGTGRTRAALAVAWCESHWNARSVNQSSGAAGVYQVLRWAHRDAPDVFNPARIAPWVRSITRGGTIWTAWVCQP